MHEKNAIIDSREFTMQIGRIASLTAIAIATSTALIYLPNIETLTLTIFIAGYVYGKKTGFLTGITVTILWEIIASALMGGFSGIVFPFKLVFWGVTGLLGAWTKHLKIQESREFMIVGGILGLSFDLFVTLGVVIPLRSLTSPQSFFLLYLIYVLQGIPFFTFPHILGNMILFSFIPSITRAMEITLQRDNTNKAHAPLNSLQDTTVEVQMLTS